MQQNCTCTKDDSTSINSSITRIVHCLFVCVSISCRTEEEAKKEVDELTQ